MLTFRRFDVLMFLTFGLFIFALPGCLSASLASDTGSRLPGHHWSDEDRQQAHAGEEVSFDFVLQNADRQLVPPTGVADYCVAMIGSQRLESEPDEFGHFTFRHRLDGVQPGREFDVRVAAYQQRGSRDFMKVGGQWLEAESPYSVADRKVAEDSIRLSIYQSLVDLRIVRPPDDLDPETGVLRIRRTDGSSTAVYINRPNRPGFIIEGPGPDGYYRVTYPPSGDELNKTGTTDVEFTIYDLAGQRHTVTKTLDTP
jgi:hypothetical protein